MSTFDTEIPMEIPAGATPYAFDPSALTADTSTVSAERIENERRERDLYGDLLADVKFLRSRDFTVNYGLCVDGRERSPEQVRAMAARERRLLAHPQLHTL